MPCSGPEMAVLLRSDFMLTDPELERMVENMPAFPNSVHRILELAADINCAPRDVVGIIEHDPVMTVKVLKLVNSVYYSLPRQIISIGHAVVYVGLNTVKNLALSITTIGMLPRKNMAGFDMNDFLLHSLATAAISRKLSQQVTRDGLDATDFFVAGLLHDFGKVVFAQFLPAEFKCALTKARTYGESLHEAEAEIIGADHSFIGSMLGEKWLLHEDLISSMREHHHAENPGNALRDCVFAANQLSKQMQIGGAGSQLVEAFPEPVANRFGMGLDDLAASLGDISMELEEVSAFAKV